MSNICAKYTEELKFQKIYFLIAEKDCFIKKLSFS